MQYIHTLLDFFTTNFPSFKLISWMFPVACLFSFLSLFIAGLCKHKLKWRTGFSRKTFHFLIFIAAFFCQQKMGLPSVFILGWSVTLVLIFAIIKGDGNLFYEALAREKDAPFRTKYIVYSYLATFFGGVISNLLFGSFAIFGYVITGIGDAIAEPIGTYFGKHQYRVFSFDKTKISYRSLEGSLAVFAVTLLIMLNAVYTTDLFDLSILGIVFIAFICTITEALSPSGFDNMLLQIVASFLVSIFVSYNH
jgi:phytol kinase